MKPSKEKIARDITAHLKKNGYDAFFAGGYVRNKLMGIEDSDDIDIATNAIPKVIQKLFKKVIGIGEHFGVMLVVEQGISFEVATFRSDHGILDGRHPKQVTFSDPKTDAKRRDFTINGIFLDPIKDTIIDYVDGKRDIKKEIIRTIGEPQDRFKEDYLRLLRAIRFAARFSFSIEQATWKAIKDNAHHIQSISQERIFQEINKMLLGPNPEKALTLLDESGLLKEVLPEIDALKGIEQPKEFHPEGDVYTHTQLTIAHIKKPTQTVMWSALLHDIGKPQTQSKSDRIRFNNHHRVSATLAKSILQRLKCSNQLINEVYACVDNHMNFMNVQKMRLSTLKKFLSRETINDELELHRADCLASHGMIDNYDFLKDKRKAIKKEAMQPPPLLSGKDLIQLGFTPGPLFGIILQKLYDLQLEEKISSYDEAKQWIIENRIELINNNNLQKD